MEERIEIMPGMMLFRFRKIYEVNMLALVSGGDCLIIDTGFEKQAELLGQSLEQEGLKVKHVVNSHFHPDHSDGNGQFSDAQFWGSSLHASSSYEHRTPDHLLVGGEEINFGPFQLKFLNLQGHCRHNLVTVINGRYAQVSDLLMSGYDGKPWIPYIAQDGNVLDYIQSLETLKQMEQLDMFIPSHGPLIRDSRQEVIEDNLFYLRQLMKLGPGSKAEDCLPGNPQRFLSTYHSANLENVFR